jgi:hypothetical protein
MRVHLWLAAALVPIAAPVAAQQLPQERPQVLGQVVACRTVMGSAERLACYDQAVTALEAAQAQNQLIVMDRQQLRRARRSVFGLTLPDLNIFNDASDDEEEVAVLESTLRGASQNGLGKWVLTLEDGARWIQIDTRDLAREPEAGDRIRIRRGTMASYLANIDGQVAIRVRRER